jgi:hypothetical protein
VPVLGLAWSRGSAGSKVPTERGIALVHVYVVVAPEPDTRNVALAGMVRHAEAAVTTPKSSDQKPPGVFGWLLGNARICSGAHGPGEHV